MKAMILALIAFTAMKPAGAHDGIYSVWAEEIWHTWTDAQVAHIEEVAN